MGIFFVDKYWGVEMVTALVSWRPKIYTNRICETQSV